MPKGLVTVELDQTDDWDSDTDWEQIARGAVEAAFAVVGFAPDARISLSINLSDNDEVQALNAQWRGKDKPTNVLSFPMLELPELQQLRHSRVGGNPSPDGEVSPKQEMDPRLRGGDDEIQEVLLGDLILAHGVCTTEAEEKQIPLTEHVTHLIIHGTLHLLGLDHIDDAEAEHMEALEVKALASLGLPNPYSDH
jgi:probable rRNA maturation factor